MSTGIVMGLASFTTVNRTSIENYKGNISFKIVNDWNADYKFCANGGHNTISKGTTRTMSYSEGTEIKYVENGNCGLTWFKVTSAMDGKTFKLSELTKK